MLEIFIRGSNVSMLGAGEYGIMKPEPEPPNLLWVYITAPIVGVLIIAGVIIGVCCCYKNKNTHTLQSRVPAPTPPAIPIIIEESQKNLTRARNDATLRSRQNFDTS